MIIFHITTQQQWQQAQSQGIYQTESLDREGFIHASQGKQVRKIADTFYRDKPNLVVLYLDTEKLSATVKWEAPIHPHSVQNSSIDEQEKFPHIYGKINLEAVIKAVSLDELKT